jgi:hypothetical protein
LPSFPFALDPWTLSGRVAFPFPRSPLLAQSWADRGRAPRGALGAPFWPAGAGWPAGRPAPRGLGTNTTPTQAARWPALAALVSRLLGLVVLWGFGCPARPKHHGIRQSPLGVSPALGDTLWVALRVVWPVPGVGDSRHCVAPLRRARCWAVHCGVDARTHARTHARTSADWHTQPPRRPNAVAPGAGMMDGLTDVFAPCKHGLHRRWSNTFARSVEKGPNPRRPSKTAELLDQC